MTARRLPGIRKPERDETPLSEEEQWIAIRESHRPPLWPEPSPQRAEPITEAGPKGEAWL